MTTHEINFLDFLLNIYKDTAELGITFTNLDEFFSYILIKCGHNYEEVANKLDTTSQQVLEYAHRIKTKINEKIELGKTLQINL